MKAAVLLLVCCTAVRAAVPQLKIVGGWQTTINYYSEVASLLYSYTGTGHSQSCGGTVINARAVLTAAHCVVNDIPARWRFRVGSSYANSGGTVYAVSSIVVHDRYNGSNHDNDLAILRSARAIVFSATVSQATIAGANYVLADGQTVWAVGWGKTEQDGFQSEMLRHVPIWTVNQALCRSRYAELRNRVTENMLCAGWLDQGGRDQCNGDSGSPLFHDKVVVGVCSWGEGCAQARYPGVNARVSRFTSWIQANA